MIIALTWTLMMTPNGQLEALVVYRADVLSSLGTLLCNVSRIGREFFAKSHTATFKR